MLLWNPGKISKTIHNGTRSLRPFWKDPPRLANTNRWNYILMRLQEALLCMKFFCESASCLSRYIILISMAAASLESVLTKVFRGGQFFSKEVWIIKVKNSSRHLPIVYHSWKSNTYAHYNSRSHFLVRFWFIYM